MEEQKNTVERELMPLEEFEKYVTPKEDFHMEIDLNHFTNFEAVKKFKSVRRAFRRGHISPYGVVYPNRPFNNRKNKPLETLKRKIYNGIKQAQSRVA